MSEEVRTKTEIPENERPPAQPEPPRAPQPPQPPQHHDDGYRSLFWPLLLIGAGVLFLLINLNVISYGNLSVLVRLWPILLIAAGIDVLFARRSPVFGGLLGLAVVGAVVVLVIAGPALGLSNDNALPFLSSGEVKHAQYEELVGGAESVAVSLDLTSAANRINTLDAGSDQLFTADVDYLGDMRYTTSGSSNRAISLGEDLVQSGIVLPPAERLEWDINLNQDLPTELNIDSGSGSVEANLGQLDLTSLLLDSASGSVQMDLPPTSYDAQVDSGSGAVRLNLAPDSDAIFDIESASGSVNVSIGAGSAAAFTVDSGSGSVTFELPADAAVQIVAEDDGSGSLNLPSWLELVDDFGDDEDDTGIWQSPGFDRADRQIVITLDSVASGSINVH